MSNHLEVAPQLLNRLIYGADGERRHTQDTAVMPDVWFELGKDPAAVCRLLLVPDRSSTPGQVHEQLSEALGPGRRRPARTPRVPDPHLAYNESSVAADLALEQIVREILPRTNWWWGSKHKPRLQTLGGATASAIRSVVQGEARGEAERSQRWLLRLLGAFVSARATRRTRGTRGRTLLEDLPPVAEWAGGVAALLAGIPKRKPATGACIWSVNRNRDASVCTWSSMKTTKADAAVRLFELRSGHLTWAVLDTGIDARHPAFGVRDADGELLGSRDDVGNLAAAELTEGSRVRRTYDFTDRKSVV